MFHEIQVKKGIRFFFFTLFIFAVGGGAGVYFEHRLIPQLASTKPFSQFHFLQNLTERVTIVQKTEQVVIREDDTVERIVSQPATAVVSLIARKEKQSTQQTGVLLTNDGLVVTYTVAPLIAPDAEVEVLFYDGTSQKARYIATDTLMNVVYYRVEGVNVPAIALANSDDSRVGRKLIVIGNSSVEYQNQLAVGILGNNNRTFNLAGQTVSSSEKWEGVFEMDLASLENFVGGPAIGFNGEMVGLVGTLRFDGTQQAFLLPANALRMSLERAIRGTLGERPVLGISYRALTKASAIATGLSRDRGALVYAPSGRTSLAVLSGSVAEKIGLRFGDIIIAVNGEEINLDNPLSAALGQYARGDEVSFLVLRDGKEETLSLTF